MRHKTQNKFYIRCFLLFVACIALSPSLLASPPVNGTLNYLPDSVLAIKKTKQNLYAKKEDTKDKKKEPVKINEAEFEPVLIGKLLENPGAFINKKIKLKGKFSSFTTLALDYEPALRKSKDYISLCIFRPDSMVPLSELKLAYPLKEAKENEVIIELEENDLLEIYGVVFSTALDEPWVDIISLKNLDASFKKEEKDEGKQLKDIKKNHTKNKEQK